MNVKGLTNTFSKGTTAFVKLLLACSADPAESCSDAAESRGLKQFRSLVGDVFSAAADVENNRTNFLQRDANLMCVRKSTYFSSVL